MLFIEPKFIYFFNTNIDKSPYLCFVSYEQGVPASCFCTVFGR